MQKVKLYVITALLLIAGPVIAIGTTVDYFHHRSVLTDGRETVAEVVDSSSRYQRRRGTVYELEVRYETEQGVRQRSIEVPEAVFETALQTGRVEVRYDADDPDYVHEAAAAPSWWLPFLGVGLAFVGYRSARSLYAQRRTPATQETT